MFDAASNLNQYAIPITRHFSVTSGTQLALKSTAGAVCHLLIATKRNEIAIITKTHTSHGAA